MGVNLVGAQHGFGTWEQNKKAYFVDLIAIIFIQNNLGNKGAKYNT